MEKQGRQGAYHQDQGQGAKGQDEGLSGLGGFKRRFGASEVAEDKLGPCPCCGAQGVYAGIGQ